MVEVDDGPPQKKSRREMGVVDVVTRFSKGLDFVSVQPKFYQYCAIWRQLNFWEESEKQDFITQFYNLAPMFSARCSDLVKAICDLPWTSLDSKNRTEFADFVLSIATFHPNHGKRVISGLVAQLFPRVTIRESGDGPEAEFTDFSDDQKEVFSLAVERIITLACSNPQYAQIVLNAIISKAPHRSADISTFMSHLRHSIILADSIPFIARELWSCNIETLIKIDAFVSRADGSASTNGPEALFSKDFSLDSNGNEKDEMNANEKLSKLMMTILCYSSLNCEKALIHPSDFPFTLWMKEHTPNADIFEKLLPALLHHVLCVQGVENVAFIYLYICSLKSEYTTKMLSCLWKLVTCSAHSPNEWKKSQNAAVFLGTIIARANYVPMPLMCLYMKEMSTWCLNYADRAGQVKSSGNFQHGIYYSTVQSLLFVICYRYRELIEANMLNDVRLWGIGRIVHSHLEPLSNIPKHLATFFVSISRYMQIVYCGHIIPPTTEVGSYFPLIHTGIQSVGQIMQQLVRRFDPADDDTATKNLRTSNAAAEVVDEDEYSFMNDDEGIEGDFDLSASLFGQPDLLI